MKPPFSNNQLNCNACPFLLKFNNRRVLSFINIVVDQRRMNGNLTHELPPTQNAQSGSIPRGKRHTWISINSSRENPGHQNKTIKKEVGEIINDISSTDTTYMDFGAVVFAIL